MNREDNLCWYHGKISRDEAEKILINRGTDGLFLVRDSNTCKGDFVLSVLYKNEVTHYQIRRHGEDAFFSIEKCSIHHGLDTLIEHCRRKPQRLVTELTDMIKGTPPPHDSRSHGTSNLLHRAIKSGTLIVVTQLISCSYRNVDAKDENGQTAIHLACRYQKDPTFLKTLISKGTNVNSRDSQGDTPLHYACRYQSTAAIQLLLDAGANVLARNNETGNVPLHDAAKFGNFAAVEAILNVNSPHMPRSTSGEFPLDYARETNDEKIIKYLETYVPPPATTFRHQWYHGTLHRTEANTILREFANKKIRKHGTGKDDPNESNNESENNESTIADGSFLVRYSEQKRSNALTVLFANNHKNFIINQKKLEGKEYYYIDNGPYLCSLEHLVEHYMRFSDGLPVRLLYPVPPKPKPPAPDFSTIPRRMSNKSLLLSSPSTEDDLDPRSYSLLNNRNPPLPGRSVSVSSNGSTLSKTTEISSPTRETSDSAKKKEKQGNFLSLTFNRRSKSKGKNKNKNSDNSEKDKSNDSFEIASKLQNLSFTIDANHELENGLPDTHYNVPTNNAAVSNMGEHIALATPYRYHDESKPNEEETYFTQSDLSYNGYNEQQMDSNCETYFVDVPKNSIRPSPPHQLPSMTTQQPSNPPLNLGYIQFRDVPNFDDEPINGSTASFTNDQGRITSIVSTGSSDSRFTLQHQLSIPSAEPSTPNLLKPPKPKPNYYIPKENIHCADVLGDGEFGSVFRGTLYSFFELHQDDWRESQLCDTIQVAVKTLHDEHGKKLKKEFLREASVMIKLKHHCIVRLIGISKGPPLMMVQELMPLGSLQNYLLNNSDKIRPSFELKVWASQIACGMNYLESQNFVHRDLAARNILLASRNQAKISDFGLSRALGMGNDYYQASQGGKWPIKWYAPESYNFGTFSHASDVWSFGITLWEMYSMGLPPYGDETGTQVISRIDKGERLCKPDVCPDHVFKIMESCWNYKPADRPTFKNLSEFFANDPDYQNLTELIKSEHIS